MASLFKRQRSQYWYIRFRDPLSGKRRRDATPYRHANKLETRNARELEAKKTYEEKKAPRALSREQWQAWVRPFLERRFYGPEQQLTLTKYLGCWRTIEAWLIEHGILAPAQVNHTLVMDYVDWRRRSRAKKPIAPGTIVVDVKVWRLIMDEAIHRGWTLVNPCLRLGLSRKAQREGRAIRDEEDEAIVTALRQCPEWMQISYEIAMAHGCRFKETRIAMTDINLGYGKVLFHAKGGKVFEVDLVPTLIPLIKDLKKRGAKYTWDLSPHDMRQCGRNWTRFFRKLSFKDLWFHCTRYTAITRAHRAEVPLAKALRFFGHSGKTLVHFLYAQLGTEDTSEVAQAMAQHRRSSISFGALPRNQSKQNRDSLAANSARGQKSSRPCRIGKRNPRLSSPSRIAGRVRSPRPVVSR
jgi:hypothetical protein